MLEGWVRMKIIGKPELLIFYYWNTFHIFMLFPVTLSMILLKVAAVLD